MNPPPSPHAWSRLVGAARRAPLAPALEEATPPPGFATRMAALGLARAPGLGSVFERLAARALGLAGACACAVVLWSALASAPATIAPELASLPESSVYDETLDPIGSLLLAAQEL